MKNVTLYLAEYNNGGGKWQGTYTHRHESKASAEADAQAAPHCGRGFRVRRVKAVRLDVGDKVEGRRITGRFSENRDEYMVDGSQAFSGEVAACDAPGCCGLRIGTIKLSHPYIIDKRGAGLIDVEVTSGND